MSRRSSVRMEHAAPSLSVVRDIALHQVGLPAHSPLGPAPICAADAGARPAGGASKGGRFLADLLVLGGDLPLHHALRSLGVAHGWTVHTATPATLARLMHVHPDALVVASADRPDSATGSGRL